MPTAEGDINHFLKSQRRMCSFACFLHRYAGQNKQSVLLFLNSVLLMMLKRAVNVNNCQSVVYRFY